MRKSTISVLSVAILLLSLQSRNVFAQDFHNFVQFYVNPSLINPSLTGTDGKSSLYFSYKKQWAGIEGAPSIANVSFQTAFQNNVSFGLNLHNEQQGLIKTSAMMFTGGYTIPLENEAMVRFGFSLGAAWNKLDINALNFGTISPTDPIQVDLLDNNFQVLGNAGISFHSKSFHIGLALPNIIEPVYLTTDQFSISKVNPFSSTIIHTSYRLYFANDYNVFEPYLVYRLNSGAPSQLEAAGILHLQHKVWLGASYKQDFGISGLGGFKLNNQIGVGYSYTLKNTGLNELNKPSHEIHIALLFGETKKNVPVYSFVDTEKTKRGKNYKAMIARQKQREKELARKHAQDLAKKEEKEKLERERAAAKAAETPVEVAAEPPVTQTPPAETPHHDAGPRMRTNEGMPAMVQEKPLHEEEQEKLARLEIHAENADEHHGEENHPNAERHEFVKRGQHSSEMNFADYVIVGAFSSEANAKRFSDGLLKLGFSSSDYGFISERNLWYVHISESNDINQARADRDKYRKMNMFKDAWLLTVHE